MTLSRTIRIGSNEFYLYKNAFELVRSALQKEFPEYKIECTRSNNSIRVVGRQTGRKVYLGDAFEIYSDVKKTKQLPQFCKVEFPLKYHFKICECQYQSEETPKKERGYEKEFLLTQENWIKNQNSYDLMISQAFEDSWPEVFIKFEDFEDGVHVCVYQRRNKEYWLDAGLRSKFIEEIKKLENDFPLKLKVRIKDKLKYWTDVVYLHINEEDVNSLSYESVSSVAKEIMTRKFFKPSFTGTKFSTNGYKDSMNRNTGTQGCMGSLESFLVNLPNKKNEKSVISFPIRFPLIVERKSIAVV